MKNFRRIIYEIYLCGRFLFSPQHTKDTEDNEGDGEDLPHVDGEGGLEGFLDLLGVLDEEAEGEDIRQTEAEVPACANLLRHFLMERPHDEEKDGVGDGFVELSGMAGHSIHFLEDKGPGHVCDLADNLRVHQVAKADKTGRGACGDGDIVEYCPDAEFGLADIEPEGDHQT